MARPELFTDAELRRQFLINETLDDLQENIQWKKANEEQIVNFRIDPNAEFITARNYREFHEWCPVRLLQN